MLRITLMSVMLLTACQSTSTTVEWTREINIPDDNKPTWESVQQIIKESHTPDVVLDENGHDIGFPMEPEQN